MDLLAFWYLLGPAGRRRFCEVYGPLTDAVRLRSRVLSLLLSAILALYARDVGLPALEREALGGLERTMRE